MVLWERDFPSNRVDRRSQSVVGGSAQPFGSPCEATWYTEAFMVLSFLSSLWHSLSSLWQALTKEQDSIPVCGRWPRHSVERLEAREVPANLTWVGPKDGLWSTPANWVQAQIPGAADTVIFNGLTKDTDSVMDLGGGAVYHIAGLKIESTFTKKITLQSNLRV